ncbi:adenylate/guanylate cyclase domain-containing protein [Desulfobacterales bacterium HSG16]|nr:adenylate/guanylate cyclase domain-containing protein [Desulfobacterales bacterium HSG16]
MKEQNKSSSRLLPGKDELKECLRQLEHADIQENIETIISKAFSRMADKITPDIITPDEIKSGTLEYTSTLSYDLYDFILKHYKYNINEICFWRFIKKLPRNQLFMKLENDPHLEMLDYLIRIYFYSDPLDDLTCLFIPVNDSDSIKHYLEWIKSYFYNVNYPTSLLWLYALDSSLASIFPDEIVFLGVRTKESDRHILAPDFNFSQSVLLKRFSETPDHFVRLEGKSANSEFAQIFAFLQKEFNDRCLSRSTKKNECPDDISYENDWKKFEDVLKFGVSDKDESGCISFSDMRASTEFLNNHGKNLYLNKIQQPFFEQTKLISRQYKGRIDKFMGDNVMCVFLKNTIRIQEDTDEDSALVLNNFFALFNLCSVLLKLIKAENLEQSKLGLRSGVTYGNQILRSNLGNEIVRDFTVTGETVNLAARLEHISIQELIIHNKMYFERSIERFPQISELLSSGGNRYNLNPETQAIIRDFTLFQNIYSNLERLENARFDIRMNQDFYSKLRNYMEKKGFKVLNPNTSAKYGYEEYAIDEFNIRFYFSYYNPKGFKKYERIWILPLETEVLEKFNLGKIRN